MIGDIIRKLIDDIGFTLLARCRSFIQAVKATKGKVICPSCGKTINHKAEKTKNLVCSCGWQLSWQEYFDTIRHQQLSGAEPVLEQFRNFIADFPIASSAREKMILIDQLIHGFHRDLKHNLPTRPVAINLIEGKLADVVSFLNELSAFEGKSNQEWQKNIDLNKDWYKKS